MGCSHARNGGSYRCCCPLLLAAGYAQRRTRRLCSLHTIRPRMCLRRVRAGRAALGRRAARRGKCIAARSNDLPDKSSRKGNLAWCGWLQPTYHIRLRLVSSNCILCWTTRHRPSACPYVCARARAHALCTRKKLAFTRQTLSVRLPLSFLTPSSAGQGQSACACKLASHGPLPVSPSNCKRAVGRCTVLCARQCVYYNNVVGLNDRQRVG